MLIKKADDKSRDIEALQALLGHPAASPETRKRVEQEIRNIKAGAKGEQDAAYEMQVHYGQGKNWAIIHDLRIEHAGLVAQIDHLVINRLLDVWVCESKHFSEGVAINEFGEFTAFYGGKPYGAPSPIEQNAKHLHILDRVLSSGRVELPTRMGFTLKPELKGLVLVSKNARIARPKKKIAGIECVIKTDQFFTTVDKAFDGHGVLSFSKVISSETLESLAKDIAKLHKPISFDWAAKFGLAENLDSTQPAVQPAPAVEDLGSKTEAIPSRKQEDAGSTAVVDGTGKPKQKLICHSCGSPVAYHVAKFCWFNKPKFDGNVFCMDCQKKF